MDVRIEKRTNNFTGLMAKFNLLEAFWLGELR